MKDEFTLGSLFDGSGGFPLGGLLAGIKPLWASEIEPFAVRVTTKRLPQIKHYGDVSSLNGAELPPVDIITFGSPCQDMSIAGKRNGLDGSRSSLFYEAVRIIKEMRCATNGKYPRFAVWENVPGAFSSNKGEDFRAVLKSCVRSRTKAFLFLNVRNGQPQETSWQTISPSPGECLTHNTGEYPREENASSLSQILIANAPEKYCLSPKACRGILQRASKRGKELPPLLKAKKAAYEQEVYSYEKSVLTAFKDARNAIVDFNKIKDIYESRLQLEQAAQTNVELAQLQYINGVIGYLDVLDAQRGYFDAQIGLSNAIRDKQITLVRLYKALGGGWQ